MNELIEWRRDMEFNEKDCLAVNPFDGDFGSPQDRTLRDKIVVSRKAGGCHLCGQQIIPGTMIRSRTDIFDGEIATYRWCTECCVEMADS
jgi:hypothetical protein